MSSRLQNFVHVAVKAVVAMSSLSRPSYGESADVATQVADLREPHPTVIVGGRDFSPDASRLAIQSGGEKINSGHALDNRQLPRECRNSTGCRRHPGAAMIPSLRRDAFVSTRCLLSSLLLMTFGCDGSKHVGPIINDPFAFKENVMGTVAKELVVLRTRAGVTDDQLNDTDSIESDSVSQSGT